MTNHENPDLGVHASVNDRVRKPGERKGSPVFSCRPADIGELLEQLNDPFELIQESPCQPASGFTPIESGGFREVSFRAFV
ncbi:MAG: hypothetical protein M9885_14365 [Burkholderiaceae bacterium]|nr:hypothetical protein [Burkholderiaceae bacterium]